jgi:hypothetical protein
MLQRLMKISEEQLEQVKAHAFDLLTWKDIAILMDLRIEEMRAEMLNESSPVFRAFWKGRTERKKLLRQPVLKLAEMGSPQAELLANQFLQEQLMSESDE